jgi:hypothetical protein
LGKTRQQIKRQTEIATDIRFPVFVAHIPILPIFFESPAPFSKILMFQVKNHLTVNKCDAKKYAGMWHPLR